MPDIAITATRIAQPVGEIGTTITVVHDKQIQDQKIQQVSDALREVPGLIVNQSGGPGTITSVFIRGASSSQTLTLIDGVEVNSTTGGDFDFSNLTTDNLSRIEVLRGAGGSLYGSSAIGGVVNVLTEEGTGAPRFSLLTDGGNWETARTVATAIGSLGKLGYSSTISYFLTNGYEPINNSYDNLSGVWRLDYHLTDNTTLRGFARYTRACVGLPEFSNETPGAFKDPNANQRDEFMLFKGEIDSQLTEKLLVRAFGSFVRDEAQTNKYPSFKNNYFASFDIPNEIRGANGEAVYTWAPGFPTLVGFDFKDLWAREEGSEIFYLPPPPPPLNLSVSRSIFSPTQYQYAGYVQQQGSFLKDHLLATGGFRFDGNSQFGQEISPSWAVAIPFRKYGVTLRANYAEGFEAPTFDDLYYPGFGNPNLPATTSSEYDGGIEKRFGEWGSFTATYFTRRIHNLITSAPSKTTTSGFEAIAIGRNDTQGVELIPSTHPFRGLSLSGNFTYVDTTFSSLSPKQPVRVPKYSGAGVAQYQVAGLLRDDDQFTTALFYQFVGDFNDFQTQPPYDYENHGGYQLFNLTVSYKLGGGYVPHITDEEVFARIQNLFNRHYSQAFGFPAPTINFEAGMKIGIAP
ncbi:MAG TPA: TonB-dependent receptor [Candidatus Binataceae bacterium]|nr:TonB-dependent receptor [Candidatus Binataceae bacterium]